jgi:5-methylcytosine-specific restriction protein A
MPTRLCSEPRCPHPATYRGRCATHNRSTNRATHRNRHIYNSKRWAILRLRVLFDHPLCPCGQLATDVHHPKDLDKGGDPWARSNLQALCHACHSRLTRRGQQVESS